MSAFDKDPQKRKINGENCDYDNKRMRFIYDFAYQRAEIWMPR